jgi:hypothetical protein
MIGQSNPQDHDMVWSESNLMKVANWVLVEAYTRCGTDKTINLKGLWLLRSLSLFTTSVGTDKILSLLHVLQTGIRTWVEDTEQHVSPHEYEFEVSSVHYLETFLTRLQVGMMYQGFLTMAEETGNIPSSVKLAMLTPLLIAPLKRHDGDQSVAIVQAVMAHLEKSYTDVPEAGWPLELRCYITSAEEEEIESSTTLVPGSSSTTATFAPSTFSESSLKRSSPSSGVFFWFLLIISSLLCCRRETPEATSALQVYSSCR